MIGRVLIAAVALLGVLGQAPAGQVEFATRPTAKAAGDKVEVAFAVSAPTDVEVAILDAKGNVVRHLAAGVLGGKKPPPEPLRAGLSQSLAWDRKDDFGKAVAADAGPFTARVRAGMGVKFGRLVGEDPYTFGLINSIVTDEEGNLYATACAGDCNQYAPTLRVFSPEGKYLRTLIPFPADLKPEAVANLASWHEARKSFIPRNFQSGNPITYPIEIGPHGLKLVGVTKKGGIVLSSGTNLLRLGPDGGNLQGPTPMWSKAAGLKNPSWNTPQLAVSPDGRCVYYSNVAGTKYQPKTFADTDPKWPQGRIYRQDAATPGDPERFYDLELPDWEQARYWLPDAWNKRTAAYGITTDAKGHLFVCDLVNQEIVEIGPDGRKVSASKVPWPERVHVAGNGDFYVICRLDKPKDGFVGKKLVKVTGRGDAAKIAAEMPLKGRLGETSALGAIGGKPVLWIAGGETMICVQDTGAAFEPVETALKPRPDAQLDWSRLAVDPERDEIYANNGTSLLFRYDGRTGQGGLLRKGGKPFYCVDMAVGYDGSLCLRTGNSFAGPLERYTRDLEPLPFPTGSHLLYDIYSRMGIGFCDKGVGAGPKGESYTSYMYGWNKYFVAGFGGDGKAIHGRFLEGKIKKPDAKSPLAKWPEERLVTTAVVGPIPAESGGIAVDLAGNVYVGMRLVPKGFTPPPGFEKDPAYTTWTGSIVKFPPSGGTVLGAVKEDDPPDPPGERVECNWKLTVVGALALYPGLGPFSGGNYGGNSSCCVCRVPRFGVDRYGRIAYPNVVTCSVTVIDNAGNPILEFGAYGNFDSQLVNPNLPQGKEGKPTVAVPEFPMAWPTGAGASEAHIYVLDTLDKRVLRADKTWAAEARAEIK
ncbi:MAG TPA: hypothetical protein VNE39_06630 [Planctomycetota bacterium]|nr:hypothetical protein [Planctomycetota bacterium]